MGTIGRAILDALAVTHKARFRFSAALGKGMMVGEMGVAIEYFDVTGSYRGVDLAATDDQTIMLKLAQVRKFHNINIFTRLIGDGHKAALELIDIYELKSPFFVSIAVQKDVNLQRSEIYVLRDSRATLRMPPIPISDEKLKVHYFRIELNLPTPELSHGVGEGLNLKKV
jgi:hypothetical protein